MASHGHTPGWLRSRPFLRLLGARLTSQAGDGIFEASLASYVLFSPQHSPDAPSIALGLAVVLLPFSVVGPFAGVILDRSDRRRALMASGAARAVLAALTALVIQGGSSGPGVAALAIAVLACSRLTLSGLSAALPLVTRKQDLVAAGGFSTTSGTAATGIGAAIGAGVRAIGGPGNGPLGAICLAAALCYLLAAAAAGRCAPGSLGPILDQPRGTFAGDLRRVVSDVGQGAAHVWSRPRARRALLAVNASRLGYGAVFVSTLLVLRADASGSAAKSSLGLGAVGAGLAVGTLAGAVVAPALARRWGRPAVVSAGLILGGVAAAALTPSAEPLLLVAASPLLGLAQQAAKVSSDAIVQEDVSDVHRGRAFTLIDMAFSVAYVLAAGIAALVIPRSGRAAGAVAAAGLFWAAAGVVHAAATALSVPPVPPVTPKTSAPPGFSAAGEPADDAAEPGGSRR